MEKFFITIKQDGVIIANMVMTECKSDANKEELAVNLRQEIANDWELRPESCSWAIFETPESYTPLKTSFNWHR